MPEYLDKDGLEYLWGKIKASFYTKSEIEEILSLLLANVTTELICLTSDAPSRVVLGESLTVTLTAGTGQSITAVTVTMGGTDITSSVYANNVITIPNVTGAVNISAAAVINFANSTVKSLCVSNWGGNDVSNEITIREAAQVTQLGSVFKSNTAITSFDELQYFTGLQSLNSQEFNGCTNLSSITFPTVQLTYMRLHQTFVNCKNLTSIDFSPLAGSSCVQIYYTFQTCTKLRSINFTGISFANCYNNIGSQTAVGGSFSGATLIDTIGGGFSGIKKTFGTILSNLPLTHDSAVVILQSLGTASSGATITFKASTKSTLTADEIAIATSKGWTVS